VFHCFGTEFSVPLFLNEIKFFIVSERSLVFHCFFNGVYCFIVSERSLVLGRIDAKPGSHFAL
jgi:hypothetical protein